MSTIKFKSPIQLPKLPSDTSVEDGVMYYNETTGKITFGQDGEVTDTVSSSELEDAIGGVDLTIANHVNNSSNPHAVTKSQVGLGNCDNTSDLNKPISILTQSALNTKADKIDTYTKTEVNQLINGTDTSLEDHISDTGNPHNVTKTQVGLSNVDNTSDLNKPISTLTQGALNLKADKSNTYTKIEVDSLVSEVDEVLNDHIEDESNPHNVTKAQVGLDRVNNTNDLEKPISTLTQNALNNKSNIGHTHTLSQITDYVQPIRHYTSEGESPIPLKIWTGSVTVGSNGVWTANISSAGFTSILSVSAIAAGGPETSSRNFAALGAVSTTSITGYSANAITTGLLLATVLTNSSSGTVIRVTVMGI